MAGVLRSVVDAVGNMFNRPMPEALRKWVVDGNLSHQLYRRTERARLAGEDQHGNRYYEDVGYQYNRHRWVEYADLKNYTPSSVPPEWHAWLHHMHDYSPVERPPPAVRYQGAHKEIQPHYNNIKAEGVYVPKGSSLRAGAEPRNWRKFEAWRPAAQ